MLIVFFYVHEIVHAEFLPLGQTSNHHVYKNILQRVMCSVREKRRELWETSRDVPIPKFLLMLILVEMLIPMPIL